MTQITQLLFEILVLILAFPAGYLLAYLCRDELVTGRKWFRLLALISGWVGVFFLFFNFTIAFSLFFIAIVSLISYEKSKDRKWVKS